MWRSPKYPSFYQTVRRARPRAWAVAVISAGFVATVAMTVVLLGAYLAVRTLGTTDATLLQLWLWALSHNRVVDFTTGSPYVLSALHFGFGIAWAVVYAAWAEPHLTGPGWRRGLVFSFVPWVASVLVLLPVVGAGPLGIELGAGPLPVLGSLVLHMVYGSALGELYAQARPAGAPPLEELPEEIVDHLASMMHAERGTAIGLAAGGLAGFGLGLALTRLIRIELIPASELALPLACVLVGAALGALAGSLIGTYANAPGPGTGTGTDTAFRK
jgi:hypothetical protein